MRFGAGLPALAVMMMAPILPALAASWRVDPAASEIAVEVTQGGRPMQGRFERFSAEIAFDPGRPEAASVVVEVDLASFTMGDAQRDQLARSEEILGAATAATARYATRSFTALGADRYEVVADLTLKGVTRELRHPVRIRVAGDTAEAEGEVVLRRPDFGIGMRQLASPDPLAFEVTVRFALQARRKGG